MRIEMSDPAALVAAIDAGITELFATRIGPAILEDQHRAVPVLTGRLDASLAQRIVANADGRPELQVGSLASATEPEGVPYCLATEFGFHGMELVREHLRLGHLVREHTRHANTPEQPYIRPSAYKVRSA